MIRRLASDKSQLKKYIFLQSGFSFRYGTLQIYGAQGIVAT